LREENEVVVWFAAVSADSIAGTSIAWRDISFHADDRLEARFFGFFLELPRAVKVTVIRYREGRLLELQRSTDEIIDSVGAVQE
jgi:hypothetical protein